MVVVFGAVAASGVAVVVVVVAASIVSIVSIASHVFDASIKVFVSVRNTRRKTWNVRKSIASAYKAFRLAEVLFYKLNKRTTCCTYT